MKRNPETTFNKQVVQFINLYAYLINV